MLVICYLRDHSPPPADRGAGTFRPGCDSVIWPLTTPHSSIHLQLACAAKRGFALINPASSGDDKPTVTYLAQPLPEEQLRYTRFNDGACDAKGRFFAGTLLSSAPNHEFGGSLYRYDPGTDVCELIDDDNITVSLPFLYQSLPHCTRRTPMDWVGALITRRCTRLRNHLANISRLCLPGTSRVHL